MRRAGILVPLFAILISCGTTARLADAATRDAPARKWYGSVTAGAGYASFSGLVYNSQVGAWAVVTPNVHLGGFLGHRFEPTYGGPVKCHDPRTTLGGCEGGWATLHTIYLGASGRFGAPVAPGTWLGFGLDLGLTPWRHAFSERENAVTVDNLNAYLSPALVLVWMRPGDPVNLGLEFKVGFEILAGGRFESSSLDTSRETALPTIGPVVQLGFAFGH